MRIWDSDFAATGALLYFMINIIKRMEKHCFSIQKGTLSIFLTENSISIKGKAKMMVKIKPNELRGKIQSISSKSAAHRIIIAAALAKTPTEIRINCVSEDISATCRCIQALGGKIEVTDNGIKVYPIKPSESALLDCGESGSTARFMLPVAAVLCKKATLVGEGRLPERPFAPLCDAMRERGSVFDRDLLPITVSGNIRSGDFYISGDVSSQFISGLLFALPLLEGDSNIILTSKLESAGYVDMTLKVLSDFGISIIQSDNGFFISGNQEYIPPAKTVTVEGDWSNAAFWIVAGAIGSDVTVCGLDINSLQRDKKIINILKMMGADISVCDGDVRSQLSPLQGIKFSAEDIPDIVPIIAVAAAAAKGTTVIKGAQRLRIKECDRLNAVCTVISGLGGNISETPDGLIIKGVGKLSGGTADSFGDHRIAMLAAIASIICTDDVIITGSEAVAKSYPRFFEDFKKLSLQA